MNSDQQKIAEEIEALVVGDGISVSERTELQQRFNEEFLIKPRKLSREVSEKLLAIKMHPDKVKAVAEQEVETVEVPDEEPKSKKKGK